MSSHSSVDPATLDRLLAGRIDKSDAITTADLPPHHALTLAATADGDPTEVVDGFNWGTVRDDVRRLSESQREAWLRSAIARIGVAGDGDIGREGIEVVGTLARDLRHDRPRIYLAYVAELHRLLRSDDESDVMAADGMFERFGGASEHRSDSNLRAFYRNDVYRRLLDSSLTKESRVSALERLRRDPFEEVTPDLLVDVFAPLKHHRKDAEVTEGVFATFEAWAREFPSNTDPDDVRMALERSWSNRGELDDEPARLDEELVVTHHVVPRVVEWFKELYDSDAADRATVRAVFESLQHVSGVRSFTTELCELVETHAASTETTVAGIDLLGSILVGLPPYHYTEDHAQLDVVKRVLFAERELADDETVRQTLQRLFEDEDRSPEVRAHAARTLLAVRPPETYEIVRTVALDGTADAEVVDAVLDAVEDHRLVGFVDIVTERIDEGTIDFLQVDRLIEVLGTLGTREIVPILLDLGGDSESRNNFSDRLASQRDPEVPDTVREHAEEVLNGAGYEAEIERRDRFRHLRSNVDRRFEAMSDRTDAEYTIRDARQRLSNLIGSHARKSVRSSATVGEGIDSAIHDQAHCAKLLFRLAPKYDRFQRLAEQIDDHRSRAVAIQNEFEEIVTEVQRHTNRIGAVERENDDLESKLKRKQNEKSDAQRRRDQLRTDRDNLDSEIKSANEKLQEKEREEPSRPTGDNEDALRGYESRRDNWKRAVRRLENDRKQKEREFKKTESKIADTDEKIRNFEDEIRSVRERRRELEREHDDLSRELDRLIAQRDTERERLTRVQRRIRDLRNQHEECAEQIEEIRAEIDRSRGRVDETLRALPNHVQNLRNEMTNHRDETEALHEQTQEAVQSRETAADQIEKRSERIKRYYSNIEQIGSRTILESNLADYEAIDASDAAAREQYDENVERWRLDSALRRSDTITTELQSKLVEQTEDVWEEIQ